jgi:hypothetical protein
MEIQLVGERSCAAIATTAQGSQLVEAVLSTELQNRSRSGHDAFDDLVAGMGCRIESERINQRR